QVVEAQWFAKTAHSTPFVSAQNQYSLLNRTVEAELAPVCLKYGLGVIPYSPLAGGFLTGKYRQGEAPPEGARLSNPHHGRRPLVARHPRAKEEAPLTRKPPGLGPGGFLCFSYASLSREILSDFVPVHYVPPGVHPVTPQVLELQVIRVLPHIDREERSHAL